MYARGYQSKAASGFCEESVDKIKYRYMFGQLIIAIASVAIVAVATIVNYGADSNQETQNPSATPTNFPQETVIPTPDNQPVFTPNPTPTSTPNNQTNNSQSGTSVTLSNWYYPGAEIAENNAGYLLMTSGDNANKVTNWYRQKINTLNMGATSVITTKANEKILNVISASGADGDVKVEISAEGGGSQIEVNY